MFFGFAACRIFSVPWPASMPGRIYLFWFNFCGSIVGWSALALDPLRHDHSLGFRPAELRRIGSIIAEQQATLLKAWHEYFAK
jgi:hypothetical protein